ncbi:MAG: hypothetical protein J0I54_17840 [Bosea sp.]|nr:MULTISPECIES: hypothetical protein [unclassified Bosea (in: a-proteobacteria)]MBN9458496.1 hypothetical protein [Bosea sp. (in: a-proteobacteria)]
MTPAQRNALRNPCFAAEETTAAAFGWRESFPNTDVTVRLTLNVGME